MRHTIKTYVAVEVQLHELNLKMRITLKLWNHTLGKKKSPVPHWKDLLLGPKNSEREGKENVATTKGRMLVDQLVA
jgi:hypothetical protein